MYDGEPVALDWFTDDKIPGEFPSNIKGVPVKSQSASKRPLLFYWPGLNGHYLLP